MARGIKSIKSIKRLKTLYHFRISSYKAVDRNVRGYLITVMLLNSLCCLKCDCTDNIVILGRISVR